MLGASAVVVGRRERTTSLSSKGGFELQTREDPPFACTRPIFSASTPHRPRLGISAIGPAPLITCKIARLGGPDALRLSVTFPLATLPPRTASSVSFECQTQMFDYYASMSSKIVHVEVG